MHRLLIVILIILLVIFIVYKSSVRPKPSNKIYYLETEPIQVEVSKGLKYLQDNPQLYGEDLLKDIKLIPTTIDKFVQQLQKDYNDGSRSVITMFGTEALSQTFEWLKAHPDFTMLNLFSTAIIDKPDNVVRFAVSDVEMLKIIVQTIPKDTIVFYDPEDLWATTTSKLLEQQGYSIISSAPTSGKTVLIIAGNNTPTYIQQVPSSVTKLYGLDGSCFFPLTGDIASKATKLKFECITYEPTVVSPLFSKVIPKTNYLLPISLDAIKYQRLLERGVPQDVIQTSTVGFTGGLEMKNNDRLYGDFSWYIFDGQWKLVRKVLVDPMGSCSINV